MGVKELFRRGETKPAAFECDRCGAIWADDKECAWCCGPVSCEKCSKVLERATSFDYDGWCFDCRKAELAAKFARTERERFEKAQKLAWSERTDVVCFPDTSVGDNGFWISEEPPEGNHEYAWACTILRPAIEASSVIESILDDFEDEAVERLGPGAEADLQDRLDDWLSQHAVDVFDHAPDYNVCVLLPGKVN